MKKIKNQSVFAKATPRRYANVKCKIAEPLRGEIINRPFDGSATLTAGFASAVAKAMADRQGNFTGKGR